MRRLVVVILAWLLALTSSAYGEVSGGGAVESGGDVDVHLIISTPGAEDPAHPGAGSDRPLVQYVVTWSVDDTPAQVGSLNGLCLVGGGTANPKFGFEYHLVGRDATGTIVDDRFECVPFPNGDTSVRPPAPPLPAIPTFAEAWNSVQLRAPAVTFDPADHGITGLDTRITTSGPTTVTIAATFRGYKITGTATLDHYTISVDGGATEVTDKTHYMFETKGDHHVAVGAVWHGVATMTGPDLPETLPAIDLGEATITSTRSYRVTEIRSVLQP